MASPIKTNATFASTGAASKPGEDDDLLLTDGILEEPRRESTQSSFRKISSGKPNKQLEILTDNQDDYLFNQHQLTGTGSQEQSHIESHDNSSSNLGQNLLNSSNPSTSMFDPLH